MKLKPFNIGKRSVAIVICVALALNMLVGFVLRDGIFGSPPAAMNLTEILSAAKAGRIDEAVWQGYSLTGKLKDGTKFDATVPYSSEIALSLANAGVPVSVKTDGYGAILLDILLSWLPLFIIAAVWFMAMRRGGGIFSIGKSRARLMKPDEGRVCFANVAGIDEAKEELEEVVEFLKSPEKFHKLGGRIPRGVLMSGPPGTGKTLLAKAVAGEAGVPFFSISGSEFVEMFVGVGASRVRDMFEQAKKSAPCIIFIDEIDAMGRNRGAGIGGGNDEREQTLNQLLVGMDGFGETDGVIVIAATNRPDVLDPALVRPGRFDRHIVVQNPDVSGREEILKVHAEKIELSLDLDFHAIARGTPGFSGADLANLVNEATLIAGRRGRDCVGMAEFEEAKDKILMGAERRSLSMSKEERRLTAYHEAGHAIVAMKVDGNDPLHKITIVPRGMALGVTVSLPESDRHSITVRQLRARLAMMYGGRVAEKIMFGEDMITTGASNDIQRATAIARKMVTQWGLSRLGAIRFDGNDEDVFLGRQATQNRNLSDVTASSIDREIARILAEAEEEAMSVLRCNMDGLNALAAALLEKETVSAAEAAALVCGADARGKI